MENLSFRARAALLAAVAWALYQGCHLMEAIDDLRLMLPMTIMLGREHRDSFYGPVYGESQKLTELGAAIANSLLQQQPEQTKKPVD